MSLGFYIPNKKDYLVNLSISRTKFKTDITRRYVGVTCKKFVFINHKGRVLKIANI